MSVLTLRASVTGIVDSQLAAAADGFTYSVTKYRATTLPSGTRPEPDSMKPLTQVVGQAPGNIVLLVRDGEVVDSALFGDGDAGPVPAAAIAELAGQSWVRDRSETVWLPELGLYRMVGRPGGGGKLLVTSASLRPASEAASRETVTVGILTALASLVTALSTLAVVRVALRPLGCVAETAAECGSSSPTPATSCGRRWRRSRDTPNSPVRTVPFCRRPPSTPLRESNPSRRG